MKKHTHTTCDLQYNISETQDNIRRLLTNQNLLIEQTQSHLLVELIKTERKTTVTKFRVKSRESETIRRNPDRVYTHNKSQSDSGHTRICLNLQRKRQRNGRP